MISFIIPAHDEARLIGGTLDALFASARTLGEPFEVLVVNDGSTDGTGEIAAARGARVIDVHVRHIAAARNAGARAARGDRLFFVDADTLVNPDVLRAAVDAMRRGAVGGGAAVDWDGDLTSWARVLIAVTRWTMRAARLAAGCFVFASREAFEAVGGFDPRLYATEELALSQALKKRGRFVILPERVITSGRKLRTHSVREFLLMTARVSLRGVRGLRDRRDLSMWYGERRNER